MKLAHRASTVRAAVTVLIAGAVLGGTTIGATVVGGAVPTAVAAGPAAHQEAATGSTTAAGSAPAQPYVHHRTEHACSTVLRAHQMTCLAIRQTDAVQSKVFATEAVVPAATPSGYGPADLASAYKLSSTGGSGATVAIVDAYNDPSAAADLAKYRSQYGLPACTKANGCLRIVNQSGATSPLPTSDAGWAGEESLDLDMVSAVCRKCHILLVEAKTTRDADLYTAEDTAVRLGAKYVSNSYGGPESSDQSSADAHFKHPGVAITASTGDYGTGAIYPATSRYVTAVGGTSLRTAATTRGWTETAWSGAGSGCSVYDVKPTWQTVTTGCAKRAEADVSAVADPNTGVAVYQTYGGSGWSVYGGTSASAPIIAATYALAGTPGATAYPASYPYAHRSSLFDVTRGSNGSCGTRLCTAGTGWDGPTGLGTPNGTAAFRPAA